MGEARKRGTYVERVAQSKAKRTQRFEAQRAAYEERKRKRHRMMYGGEPADVGMTVTSSTSVVGDWRDVPETAKQESDHEETIKQGGLAITAEQEFWYAGKRYKTAGAAKAAQTRALKKAEAGLAASV